MVAHDDDGLNFVATMKASGAPYYLTSNFASGGANAKDNHRGMGGNILYLDGRVEWNPTSSKATDPWGPWKQTLANGFAEWYRVTLWHLGTGDKFLRKARRRRSAIAHSPRQAVACRR